MRTSAQIPQYNRDLEESGRLTSPVFRRYERDLEYTADAYVDTLHTYSNILVLSPDHRAGLLGCLHDLIESSYQGRIRKRYLFELRVAQRRH